MWKRVNITALLLAGVCSLWSGRIIAAAVAYSYVHDSGGGAALVHVDPQSGEITSHDVIMEDRAFSAAKKVRVSEDGEWFILANSSEVTPSVLVGRSTGGKTGVRVPMRTAPDEIRIQGHLAVIGCDDGWIEVVDMLSQEVVRRWNSRHSMVPAAHKAEDLIIAPDGRHLIVSFQKDSSKGDKWGSRIAVLSWPELKLKADIELPRNRGDVERKGALKLLGPQPEVLLTDTASDTLFVTLDLYGAAMMCDLSAALHGTLRNRVVYPLSLDGRWGTAFPDRAGVFRMDMTSYVLCANAGPAGGTSLIDLDDRLIRHQWETPPGLEIPVYLHSLRLAVSVCSGKVKWQGQAETEKVFHPQPGIFVFDLARTNASLEDTLSVLPTQEDEPFRIEPVDPERSHIVVMAVKTPEGHEIRSFDMNTRVWLDSVPAYGHVKRMTSVSQAGQHGDIQ